MSTLQKVTATLGVVLFVLMVAFAGESPVAAAKDAPKQIGGGLPDWISILPAADCSTGCWQVDRKATRYLPEGEAGGLHHVFLKTIRGGQQVGGVTWFLAWPTPPACFAGHRGPLSLIHI